MSILGEKDKEFRDYFNKTFNYDLNTIDFAKEDVLQSFEFDKNDRAKDTFLLIRDAFEKGEQDKIELFLRKIDLLEKDRVEYFTELNDKNQGKDAPVKTERIVDENGNYLEGENNSYVDSLQDLYDNKRTVSKMSFERISNLLNSMTPYEVYNILNTNDMEFKERRAEYVKEFSDAYIKRSERLQSRKDREIASALNVFGGYDNFILNQNGLTEMFLDFTRYGIGRTLKAYANSFGTNATVGYFGRNSMVASYESIRDVIKNRKIMKSIEKMGFYDEFNMNYENLMKMYKKEYVNTDLESFLKVDSTRKNNKFTSLESTLHALNFNMQDYLKDFKEIEKVFLKDYKIRSVSKSSLIKLSKNFDDIMKGISSKTNKRYDNSTYWLVFNKVILNRFFEDKLKDREYITITNPKSEFFGCEIPLLAGKMDIKSIRESLKDSIPETNIDNFIEGLEKETNSYEKNTNLLFMITEELNDVDGFNDVIFNMIDFLEDKYEMKFTDEQKDILYNIDNFKDNLSKVSNNFTFMENNFNFKSKFDSVFVRILDKQLNEEEKLKFLEFLKNNSKFVETRQSYDPTFSNLYFKIVKTENMINEKDLNILNAKKYQIEKMLLQEAPITEIVKKFGFEDEKQITLLLNKVKENYENIISLKENDLIEIEKENTKDFTELDFFFGELDLDLYNKKNKKENNEGDDNTPPDDTPPIDQNTPNEDNAENEDSGSSVEPKIKRTSENKYDDYIIENGIKPAFVEKVNFDVIKKHLEEGQKEEIDKIVNGANNFLEKRIEKRLENDDILDKNYYNALHGIAEINQLNELGINSIIFNKSIMFKKGARDKIGNFQRKQELIDNKIMNYVVTNDVLKENVFNKKFEKVFEKTDKFYIEIDKINDNEFNIELRDLLTDKLIIKNGFEINNELSDELQNKLRFELSNFDGLDRERKFVLTKNLLTHLDVKNLEYQLKKDFTKNIKNKMEEKEKIYIEKNVDYIHKIFNIDIGKYKSANNLEKAGMIDFCKKLVEILKKDNLDDKIDDFSKEFNLKYKNNEFKDKELLEYVKSQIKLDDRNSKFIKEFINEVNSNELRNRKSLIQKLKQDKLNKAMNKMTNINKNYNKEIQKASKENELEKEKNEKLNYMKKVIKELVDEEKIDKNIALEFEKEFKEGEISDELKHKFEELEKEYKKEVSDEIEIDRKMYDEFDKEKEEKIKEDKKEKEFENKEAELVEEIIKKAPRGPVL